MFFIIFRISKTELFKFKLTLVGTGTHVVLLLSVLQNALRTEHLVAVLAEKFNLLVLMGLAHGNHRTFGQFRFFRLAGPRLDRKRSQHCVVHRQGVGRVRVDRLVEGALDLVVLADFQRALVAEGVSAGVRERLLLLVVVPLVADLAVED